MRGRRRTKEGRSILLEESDDDEIEEMKLLSQLLSPFCCSLEEEMLKWQLQLKLAYYCKYNKRR